MNRNQLLATSFLAVLIVASVMMMPRTPLDGSAQARPIRASGMIATTAAAPSAELAADQVRDLTYN